MEQNTQIVIVQYLLFNTHPLQTKTFEKFYSNILEAAR